jgi:hypothetical protein
MIAPLETFDPKPDEDRLGAVKSYGMCETQRFRELELPTAFRRSFLA